MAQYRFFADHYTDGGFIQAGSVEATADVGGVLPAGWQPTGAVDPLDQAALAAFYAMGRKLLASPPAVVGDRVSPAVRRWVLADANSCAYSLTGLGAGSPFRQLGVNGAAMGAYRRCSLMIQ